jgi:hypothetical protein
VSALVFRDIYPRRRPRVVCGSALLSTNLVISDLKASSRDVDVSLASSVYVTWIVKSPRSSSFPKGYSTSMSSLDPSRSPGCGCVRPIPNTHQESDRNTAYLIQEYRVSSVGAAEHSERFTVNHSISPELQIAALIGPDPLAPDAPYLSEPNSPLSHGHHLTAHADPGYLTPSSVYQEVQRARPVHLRTLLADELIGALGDRHSLVMNQVCPQGPVRTARGRVLRHTKGWSKHAHVYRRFGPLCLEGEYEHRFGPHGFARTPEGSDVQVPRI